MTEATPGSSSPAGQSRDSTFRLLLGGFVLLYLLPIWLVRFPPLVDMPQHLAFVSILRNFANPASGYAQAFTLHLFPAHNVLHLFFCYALSFLTGIEAANRIFLSIYIVLLPLALLHLVNSLSGNRWLAFLGLLFVYNFNLLWGFLSTAMAIPPLLFLISAEIRWLFSERTAYWRLVLISLLFILVFLGHSLIYLFSVLLYLLILAGLARKSGIRRARLGWALVPLLPVLFLFVIPWQAGVFGSEEGNLLSLVLSGDYLQQLLSRPSAFFPAVGLRADEFSQIFYKLVLVIGVAAAVLYASRNRPAAMRSPGIRTAYLLAAASIASYLFFPSAIRQAWFLNERLAVFVCLFVVVLLAVVAVPVGLNRRWVMLAVFVVLLLNAANVGYRFLAFNRQAAPVARVLDKLPEDRKLLGLIYEYDTHPDLTGYQAFLQFPCYYQVWKRGFPGFSFASIRFSPIQYREQSGFIMPGYEWSPWYQVFPDGWKFFDYFLVHGSIRLPDEDYIGQCRLVARDGSWAVYQRPDSSVGGTP